MKRVIMEGMNRTWSPNIVETTMRDTKTTPLATEAILLCDSSHPASGSTLSNPSDHLQVQQQRVMSASHGTAVRHVHHQGFPVDEKSLPSPFHRLMRTRAFLVFWVLFIIAYSTVPVVFLTAYVFIIGALGIVGHRKLRTFSDWSIRSWLCTLCFIFRYILGINVKVFGDSRSFDNHCLFIMNHRCHLDWMFFWNVAAKLGNLSWWMVILKNSLKRVPIIGWAMQYRNYIFLSRVWETDYKEFSWKLHYLNATGEPYQFLMFPEGRDLTLNHQKKSDQFADERNVPRYEYSLHPKTKGFVYAIKTLKKGRLQSVYDMTVGYPDVFAPTELEFISQGRIPCEVHYHVKRYDVSELPESEEDLEAWLRQRWAEKEERLRLFYKHRKFVQLPCDCVEGNNSALSSTYQISNGTTSHIVPSLEVTSWFPWLHFLEGLVFLLVLCGGSLLLCYHSWLGIAVLAFSIALNGYFCTYHNKMDYMIMDHFRKTCAEFLPADKDD